MKYLRLENFVLAQWYSHWEILKTKQFGSERGLGLYFKTKGLVEHDRIIDGEPRVKR